jgi:hypothetical protein
MQRTGAGHDHSATLLGERNASLESGQALPPSLLRALLHLRDLALLSGAWSKISITKEVSARPLYERLMGIEG